MRLYQRSGVAYASPWPKIELSRRSENRYGIPGRARGARQTQRQADDHEFPALLVLASLGELLQLKTVGDQHAHGGELQGMDGIRHFFDIAGNRLAVSVGKEGGDFALMHPGH